MAYPWSRRKTESAQAYAAFTAYYQLPIRERSIDAAYVASTGQQLGDGKRAPRRWAQWSSDYEWVARSAAYDEHLAEQDRLAWEERRRRLRERDWEQADALRAVVEEAIPHANQFIRRQTTTIRGTGGQADREIITLQFDITALASVLERASKLQRLATDEPTDNIKLSGAALDAAIARELEKLVNGGEAGASESSA